jgi:hypothetical protein
MVSKMCNLYFQLSIVVIKSVFIVMVSVRCSGYCYGFYSVVFTCSDVPVSSVFLYRINVLL